MRKMKRRIFPGTTDSRVTEREIKHRVIARKAAAEGIVLLKNEGNLLPLKNDTAVALYGIGASRTVKGGTGSGDVNERESVSIYQGLVNAGFRITSEAWIEDFEKQYVAAKNEWRDDIMDRVAKSDSPNAFFEIYATTPFAIPAGEKIIKTDAETAVFVLSRIAGEGADRYNRAGDYQLTEQEHQQLADICSLYKHVVVIINAGGLVELSFMDEFSNIEALLHIVQPGMEGGNAVADILSGKVTPSGKMTDTWAYRYEDYPSSENFSHNNGNIDQEFYTDGLYVGYRYFDSFDVPVRYPFGFGLSYTTFSTAVQGMEYDSERKTIHIDVNTTNSGREYAGKEVVQVYATCPTGKLTKEYRRLVAFAKTTLLKPGESQKVSLDVPMSYLTSYDEKSASWILESGPYVIWIGNSITESTPVGVVYLDGDAVMTKTKNICPMQMEIEEIKPANEKIIEKLDALMQRVEELKLPEIEISADTFESKKVIYKHNTEWVPQEAYNLVSTLSTEELIALASGDPAKDQSSNLGSAGVSVPGAAGETNDCCESKGIAGIALVDGPAGLRLMKHYNLDNGKLVRVPFHFNLENGFFYTDTKELPGTRYYQYCTAIPVGTLLAQSWDTALLKEVGAMIGREMEEFYVTLWLAPGMNIHRNPLCGRNFEYYSEDPVLSGKIAAAMTDGVQSIPGCGTTIKHFACNNLEDNRMGNDSVVSERVLREIYLKGFEIAVKEAQPMSIMTSYNLINGVHAANNYDICTNVARNEWGFAGMIMTDWTTTEHGADCTAAGCMRAGNDLIMPGAFSDRDNLVEELANGSLDIEELRACISRLVNLVWQSNQYEDANVYPFREKM